MSPPEGGFALGYGSIMGDGVLVNDNQPSEIFTRSGAQRPTTLPGMREAARRFAAIEALSWQRIRGSTR